MLSCKKCGATMSGIDLVCKKCGTPWGKTGKSKAPVYFSILLILFLSLSFLYLTNKELFYKILPIEYLKQNLSSAQNSETAENIPENVQTPQNETPKITEPPITELPAPKPEVTEPEVILPPIFTNLVASSSLPSQGKFSYTPNMITDNDTTTAWLEAVKGNGINEWIKFSADTEQTVSGIKLFNGYQKNATTYTNNGRLKQIKIEFSNSTSLTYDLPNQTYKESQNGIDIVFESPIKTNTLKITILDVYKGVYYTDTGITQIDIY